MNHELCEAFAWPIFVAAIFSLALKTFIMFMPFNLRCSITDVAGKYDLEYCSSGGGFMPKKERRSKCGEGNGR